MDIEIGLILLIQSDRNILMGIDILMDCQSREDNNIRMDIDKD
jgi:hypothetical protein